MKEPENTMETLLIKIVAKLTSDKIMLGDAREYVAISQ
jgi:hypothetical protein